MKVCLHCLKEYEPKRETSKFCSTSCRVGWYQKHSKGRSKVTQMDMQELYKAILGAVDKIQFAAPQKEYDAPKLAPATHDEPLKFVKPVPKVAADAIMRKYVEDRRDCNSQEEFISWCERLENDERLTSKQIELVKNTH